MSNSSNDSTKSTDSIPDTPGDFKRYIVISKKKPTSNKNKKYKEIHNNTTYEDLIKDIEILHNEVNDVVNISKKIYVDCSGCFKFKTKVKTGNNKVSAI